MNVLHARCAGLDVHKKTVVACVRIASGSDVTQQTQTFATTTKGLGALAIWLHEHAVTHVVMESTGVYWKPVWHILDDGELTLLLANARDVRNLPGRKTDVSDAAWLADLLAHGLVRASFVPPSPIQELRDLTRTRKHRQAGSRSEPPTPFISQPLLLWLLLAPGLSEKEASIHSDMSGACRRNTWWSRGIVLFLCWRCWSLIWVSW